MKLRVFILIFLAGIIMSLIGWSGRSLQAFPSGVTGHSGNPATGGQDCSVCHEGGIEPEVGVVGLAVAEPGEVMTYSFRISGGQETAAGFNVSVTEGDLATLPGAMDVLLQAGELTHTEPKLVDSSGVVDFTFTWMAPVTPTAVTLYGAGNSVNLADGTGGDGVNTAVYTITVANVSHQVYLPFISTTE